MGIIEKIKEIEAEMARTQKNKATGNYWEFLCIFFQYIYFIVNFNYLEFKKMRFLLLGVCYFSHFLN